MMKASRLLIASLVATSALVGTAAADDPPADDTAAEPAPDGTAPDPNAMPMPDPNATPPMDGAAPAGAGLTLGKGKLLIAGSTLNVNLSADAVAKPLSIAPSIWYGVSDKLTIGVTHDGGTTMWTPSPAPGAGICVTGEENGCGKVYDNIGLDALFGISSGKFSLAAHPGLDVLSFDPLLLSLRLGVLGHYAATDKIAVVFDPRIRIGLTERDFNKEEISIPVYLWFKANQQLGAYVATGIAGPLDGFGDFFTIPVGVGATYAVNEKLSAGLDFWFFNLAGKGGGADFRGLGLRLAYAL